MTNTITGNKNNDTWMRRTKPLSLKKITRKTEGQWGIQHRETNAIQRRNEQGYEQPDPFFLTLVYFGFSPFHIHFSVFLLSFPLLPVSSSSFLFSFPFTLHWFPLLFFPSHPIPIFLFIYLFMSFVLSLFHVPLSSFPSSFPLSIPSLSYLIYSFALFFL